MSFDVDVGVDVDVAEIRTAFEQISSILKEVSSDANRRVVLNLLLKYLASQPASQPE